MSEIAGYAFIFFARVLDVTLSTTRILFLVRGKRLEASAVGFFEILIYIVALSMVVTALGEPLKLVVYALGFAFGNLVGSFAEEKLAIGFLTVHVVPQMGMAEQLAAHLREHGFGVTVLTGQGREGPRKLLLISLRRKALPRLIHHIEEHDPGAFFTVLETRRIHGGVFDSRKGK